MKILNKDIKVKISIVTIPLATMYQAKIKLKMTPMVNLINIQSLTHPLIQVHLLKLYLNKVLNCKIKRV